MGSTLHIIGCLLLLPRLCAALDYTQKLPDKRMATFTFTRSLYRRRPYTDGVSQLQAQSTKKNRSLLELMPRPPPNPPQYCPRPPPRPPPRSPQRWSNIGNINSVHDFDNDLANNIQDAPVRAGVDGNDGDNEDVTDDDMNGYTPKVINKIIRPQPPPPPLHWSPPQPSSTSSTSSSTSASTDNKAPRYVPQSPPHTALAQVLANQHGFDLTSVSPLSKGPGGKITAEDVEHHAWKVSQPPCTEKALELAHFLGLDLNSLYDDEDREYVLQLSDVEMFQVNERSLKMSSQTRKGGDCDQSSRKRKKKMSALDKRMEQNLYRLSKKALKLARTTTDAILQQGKSQIQTVQLKANEKLREVGVFEDMNDKMADDISTVEDLDSNLADEMQEPLSTSHSDMNDIMTDDIKAVGDFDTNLASEIQEALSSADSEGSDAVEPAASPTREELQAMTVVQLKDQLRRLGMKVSGRKAELVERLFDMNDADD